MFNDAQNRAAIAAAIKDAVGDVPVIYDFWALGFEPLDWPGLVRLPDGSANGFVVTRLAIGPPEVKGNASDFPHLYTITSVYSFGPGSEDAFGAQLDAITAKFPAGAFQVAPDCFHPTRGISWTINLYPFGGGELCHHARGDIQLFNRIC